MFSKDVSTGVSVRRTEGGRSFERDERMNLRGMKGRAAITKREFGREGLPRAENPIMADVFGARDAWKVRMYAVREL